MVITQETKVIALRGKLERKQPHHQKLVLVPDELVEKEFPPSSWWSECGGQLAVVTITYPEGWVSKKQGVLSFDNSGNSFCALRKYDGQQKIVAYLCGEAQIRLNFEGRLQGERPAYLIEMRHDQVTLKVD